MTEYVHIPIDGDDGLGAIAPPPVVTIRKDAAGNTINSAGVIIKTAAGKTVTPAQATKMAAQAAAVAEAEKKSAASVTADAATGKFVRYGVYGIVGLIGLGIAMRLISGSKKNAPAK